MLEASEQNDVEVASRLNIDADPYRTFGEQDETNMEVDLFQDLVQLKHLWINERYAPELLPFATKFIEDMMELVENQEAILERMYESHHVQQSFMAILYEMELERWKYILRSYLETRLLKIEYFARYLAQMTPLEQEKILSASESLFLRSYLTSLDTCCYEMFAKDLPPPVLKYDEKGRNLDPLLIVEPDRHVSVTVHVLENVGEVELDQIGRTEELLTGQIYQLKYDVVTPLLTSGKVTLI